jgi:acyl-coenzyme A synthetase/AMP-(fatty) acid ligase
MDRDPHGEFGSFLLASGLDHRAALFDAKTGNWLSYGLLKQRVAVAAQAVANETKALVLLTLRNDVDSAIRYLGALKAGHAVLVLDETGWRRALADLVERYCPEFVICDSESGPAEITGYDAIDSNIGGARYWRRQNRCEIVLHPELTLMLPTSGSTGNPKFVRLSQRNLACNIDDIISVLGITSGEVAVSSLPLHYSYGLSVLHTHLRAGAAVVITDETVSSPGFWEQLRSQRCTSLAGVPYTYRVLRHLDIDRLRVPSLMTLTQAGGKLENELVLYFSALMRRRGGRFFVMYGQTEAGPRITTLPAEDLPDKCGSVGKALPSGRIWSDVGDAEAKPGAAGEIRYRGPNVMMGYAEAGADLALGSDEDAQLRTGDLGYLDSDGYLFITGRLRRIAKIMGHRLNLDDIEAMLAPTCTAAVVERENRLHVYTVEAGVPLEEEIRARLVKALQTHPSLIDVHYIGKLPINANGKIEYGKLR